MTEEGKVFGWGKGRVGNNSFVKVGNSFTKMGGMELLYGGERITFFSQRH